MIANFREFAYSTDAQLTADVAAWFATLRAAGTPPRDFRLNFITAARVLATATYGAGVMYGGMMAEKTDLPPRDHDDG
jgi:hypothetical protein